MTREELIKNLKTWFKVLELVCPHCYNKFGEKSWLFLSTPLLSTLYNLRAKVFNKPMTINTWHHSGQYSQRGLRCNMCLLVRDKKSIYLSQHLLGNAIDFNVDGLTSDEANNKVRECEDLFDYPIRLEANTNGWSHVDCMVPYGSSKRLVEFNG